MPSLLPLDKILGAPFIGLVVSAIIYGVTLLQCYSYYMDYPDDRRFTKIFVAVVLTLDTLHLGMVTQVMYHYCVQEFGDYFALAANIWSLEGQVPVGTTLTTLVQCFYAYRVWILSSQTNRVMPVLIVICAIATMAGGIGFAVRGVQQKFVSDTTQNLPLTVFALTSELVGDTLVAGSMIYYLRQGHGDFRRTNAVLSMLIKYTISSGLLTTILAAITLATYAAYVGELQLIFAPFFFVLVRIYTCSFMSLLNSRKIVRAKMTGISQNSDPVALSDLASQQRRFGQLDSQPGKLAFVGSSDSYVA